MENNTELIVAEFEKMKLKLSKADKEKAGEVFDVHPVTIARYLRGNIAKEPFALELLFYFRGIISKRERVLVANK